MAATEASAAPVVQEDGKTPETKPAEAEQPAKTANSETVKSEAVDKDGTAVNSEAVDNQETVVNSEEVDNQETVNNDTAAPSAEKAGEEEEGGEAAPPQSSENTSAEPKTSFLDSFLNKSGLGKVMAGRKKKEHGTAAGGAEEASAEGGEKEGEKGGEEAEGGADGGMEGEATTDKPAENGEKEEDKKSKPADTKSTVRDLIRKPVARIFSHRSTEKKDGAATEPEKQVKVRSRSLDRLEDPEALNATADSATEEGGATGGAEGEQKTSSSTKHMKRWHSFKKIMAQKAHKKSGGGGSGEDGKEEGVEGEGGGGDSSTLDSKESGHKKWKLKRSWTFQGLKRDSSVVGISSKAKSSDKESADKAEEGAGGGEEEEGEAKAEAGGEESKTEGDDKAEGGEEEKAGGGTVTQHANEIWTSFKKRVIPKSKRANTECAPTGEEDATAAAASAGEEAAAEEGKDSKSAKAKRSHFGRAVSLKNFIMRKGKSSSVDQGEAAKEEEEAAEGGDTAEEAGADGEAATAANDTNDKEAAAEEKTTAEEDGAEAAKEPEKTAVEAPDTNGETGCSNGVAEENATENHQEEEEDREQTTDSSPVKKSKEAGGVKDDANAKIINATVNSGEFQQDCLARPQNGCKGGETNRRQSRGSGDELKLEEEEGGEAESPQNGGYDWEEREEEMRKRDLRQAAVAIVQSVMSAAADQLERELRVNNGFNGDRY